MRERRGEERLGGKLIREWVVALLDDARWEEARAVLLHSLKGGKFSLRAEVISLVGKLVDLHGPEIEPARVIPILVEGFGDEDWAVFDQAGWALEKLGEDVVPHYVEGYRRAKDPDIRLRIIVGLGAFKGSPEVLRVLEEALADPSPWVRVEAVSSALARNALTDRARATVINDLANEDAEIRIQMAVTAAHMGLPEAEAEHAIDVLIARLTEGQEELRWSAAFGLQHFRARAARAAPALIEALRDPSDDVRTRAARSLEAIRRPPPSPPA